MDPQTVENYSIQYKSPLWLNKHAYLLNMKVFWCCEEKKWVWMSSLHTHKYFSNQHECSENRWFSSWNVHFCLMNEQIEHLFSLYIVRTSWIKQWKQTWKEGLLCLLIEFLWFQHLQLDARLADHFNVWAAQERTGKPCKNYGSEGSRESVCACVSGRVCLCVCVRVMCAGAVLCF